jgi:hypothetical protein
MARFAEQQPQGCWPCCWPHGPGNAPDFGVKLIIATAVWTKGVPVHEQYAALMLQLFQVCKRVHSSSCSGAACLLLSDSVTCRQESLMRSAALHAGRFTMHTM